MTQTRRVELGSSPDRTFETVVQAMSLVGKVEDANAATRTVVGKARYGLNPVRLRIAVLTAPGGAGSVVEIGGKGQDVWGAASRKVTDRLIEALGR